MNQYEEKLNAIRKDVSSMRDKAVSAKTIQEQSHQQIQTIVSNILDSIDNEDRKAAIKVVADEFLANLADDSKAIEFFDILSAYIIECEEEAAKTIEEVSAQIAEWKEKIG